MQRGVAVFDRVYGLDPFGTVLIRGRILIWGFPKNRVPYFGVLVIRVLLFRVLYLGPLFSETPSYIPGPIPFGVRSG